MKESVLISIIIPTYNYGHLIAETLNCILNQQYTNWEAIVIDDGSTDTTFLEVKNFIDLDKRFKYLYQDNSGVSVARNSGIAMASGSYIQFLDADDLISPKKIYNQILFLEKNKNVSISLVNTKYFNDSGAYYSDLSLKNASSTPKIHGSGFEVISAFVGANQLVIQSAIFKKSIIADVGLFDEKMNYLEDWDFWFRFATRNYHFDYLDNEECFAIVRVHTISATQKSTNILDAEAILRRKFETYIRHIDFLKKEERLQLIAKNKLFLINTFKNLMANLPFSNLRKWNYYLELLGFPIFLSCVIKALNIKRKRSS